MKKFKKLLAAVFAFTLTLSGLSVLPAQAAQDASALEDGTAYLNNNEWNTPDPTATAGDDNHADCRVAEGSVEDATACLFSSDYVDASSQSGFLVQSIEVTFTVAGTGMEAEAGEAPVVESVDLNGTYHAYFGLQTPTFSFRNAFDDTTYGRDTEYFNQITGWEGSDAVKREGSFTDAEIAGNGTYTVSVSGMDLKGDFDSQDYFNLIFLLVEELSEVGTVIAEQRRNVLKRDILGVIVVDINGEYRPEHSRARNCRSLTSCFQTAP